MSRNKERPSRARTGKDLAQYGIFGLPSEDDNLDAENDSDLEAELLALSGESQGRSKNARPRKKPLVPASDLDAMVAASLRDIPDDEISGDDDDPDLLSELQEIAGEEEKAPVLQSPTQPSAASNSTSDIGRLLEERLKMYELAESHAKTIGESSRARRYNRAIKTLKDLVKQAKAGKTISPDDIPPEVSTNVKKPTEPVSPASEESSTVPTRPAPSIPSSTQDSLPPADVPVSEPEEQSSDVTEKNKQLLSLLNTRKDQYKKAALNMKKVGDKERAIGYIKIAKQFESVISAVESGQPVDLSRMPGPPEDPPPNTQQSEVQQEAAASNPEPSQPPPQDAPAEGTLITANSVEEALQQRLEVYQKQVDAAKAEGNSSKARRMGRVVKQFEDALKLHRSGRPVPVDELPTPPGYGPIPVAGGSAPAAPRPAPRPKAEPGQSPPQPRPSGSGRSGGGSARISGNHSSNNRVEQQVLLLLAKQKEFKQAALSAKQKGEINQAKEYLKTAKGFDPLIEAARGGLPVDLSSLPVSPTAKSQLDEDYDLVMAEEVDEEKSEDFNLIARLEAQLSKQLKMCLTTRDHHKALGDVAGMNRFEQLALSVTRDLDVVRLAQRTPGCRIPKFHYENKDFSIVKSFTDLGDNDLELVIVRGVNYLCDNPKEVDTYVKFEFPFPQEEPYKDKTVVIKDTNNPEYNATFVIPIQRTARTCLRVFKRHGIKFEIYSKGGFFRGDTLLGNVAVKLQPLETECELHDSFDLMDGRKKVGGKLEVRLRVRHPLLTKQIEKIHEKWLVLDH